MPKIEISPNGHSLNGNGIRRIEVEEMNGGGITNVRKIKGASEQEMFLFLRKRFPNWKITYEPLGIWIHYVNGVIKGTVPDFGLQKPNDAIITLLEITTNRRNGTDPKAKQKMVMQDAQLPNVRFVVLYGRNLRNIMRKHPEANFFRAKRIRKA